MISRRILIGTTIVLVLAFGVYAGYWHYVAWAAQGAVDRWAKTQRAMGQTVTYRAGPAEGFPLLVRLPLAAPRIEGPTRVAPAEAFSWEADALALELQPWKPFQFRIEPTGPQRVAAQVEGVWQHYQVVAERAVGLSELRRDGRVARAAFDLDAITVTDAAGTLQMTARRAAGRILLPETPPARHTEAAANVSAMLHDAVFPAAEDAILGHAVPKLELVAELRGAVPNGPEREALEVWRRDGGTVEIAWLSVAWGPLDLRAKGTATLDEEMRPLGALTADIRGYGATLDAFARAEMVKPEHATTARVALDLLARPDGAGRVLTVPLTAQNGALFVGPVRLLSLRPIPL